MSNKNLLHLVCGASGGVGASWFAKLLIETHRSLNLEYSVVDTDESALDVDRSYNPDYYNPIKVAEYQEYVKMMKKENEYFRVRKQIHFIAECADDWCLPDEIIELTMKNDTIVNIPVKVNKVSNQWIEKDCLGLFEDDLEVVFWFVATPTSRSIQELKKLYNYHNGRLKITLVKNNLFGEGDWNLALDRETKVFLERADIPQVEIGNLKLMPSLYDQNRILNDDYPAFFELLDPEDDRLTDDLKEQLFGYLRMTADAIVGTGLLSSSKLEAKI